MKENTSMQSQKYTNNDLKNPKKINDFAQKLNIIHAITVYNVFKTFEMYVKLKSSK